MFRQRIITLLRRAERVTGTDNVYLVKNSTYLTLAQATTVINGLILYIVIGRMVPREIYGEYKYFLNIFSLLATFSLTGMETALIRSLANGYDGAVHQAFQHKLRWSILGTVFCVLAAMFYIIRDRTDLATGFLLMGFFAPLIYAANVYPAYLQGKKRFKDYSLFVIGTTIFSCTSTVVAFVLLPNPIYLLSVFLVSSLPTGIFYLHLRSRFPVSPQDPTITSYGKYLSFLDLFGTIATNIDSIIVFHRLGATELALYSFAILPVEQIKGFLKTIQAIAQPKFAAAPYVLIRKSLPKKVTILFLGTVLVTAAYIVCAPFAFRFLFPNYNASIPYTRIFALSLVFVTPAAFLSTVFQAKALKKQSTTYNIASYSLQIILLVIGAWQFGIWGAIISRVIARASMLGIALLLLQRSSEPNHE